MSSKDMSLLGTVLLLIAWEILCLTNSNGHTFLQTERLLSNFRRCRTRTGRVLLPLLSGLEEVRLLSRQCSLALDTVAKRSLMSVQTERQSGLLCVPAFVAAGMEYGGDGMPCVKNGTCA